MNKQNSKSFSYSFHSSKSPKEIFTLLLNINNWWNGLYAETIKGKSGEINDEFSFQAGGGAHYSNQKLIELIPDKRVVWEVTESNLSFLNDTNEWANTKICFDLSQEKDQTNVKFTHEGLVPKIECYDSCTNAWTKYLERLEEKLK